MATQVYYFTGKVNWSKVYPGQEDKDYGHFGLDFYPDNVEEFTKTGVQLKPREGDEGKTFFSLRRKPQQLIRGELVNFGPPEVLDKENKPFTKPIGNGSTCTVKVTVYDSVKGKGHRLDAVRVEEWVEFKTENTPVPVNVPKLPF